MTADADFITLAAVVRRARRRGVRSVFLPLVGLGRRRFTATSPSNQKVSARILLVDRDYGNCGRYYALARFVLRKFSMVRQLDNRNRDLLMLFIGWHSLL